MSEQQVRIGREFFEKIKLDYADWQFALIREFLQNCFDAPGVRNVAVTIEGQGNLVRLTVSNDGAPMDRETLTTKLLTLGGSGKNFAGENTGGFGVAKSLLYYTHESYVINTGSLLVVGSGAQYTITEDGAHISGTVSTVVVKGTTIEDLKTKLFLFAAYAQNSRVRLTVNGRDVACDLKKGARRKDLGWGVVYTNKTYRNTCVIRLNGQPMFTRYTRFPGCVVIELTGKSCDVLTSNRDDLKYTYSSELSDLLTALAVDKRSALREQRAEYRRYRGELQKAEARKPREAEEGLADVVDVAAIAGQIAGQGGKAPSVPSDESETPTPVDGPRVNVPATATGGGIRVVVASREDETDTTISVGPQFILKNCTGKKVPARYTPGASFVTGARQLVRAWTAVLLKLHTLMGHGGEFSVGFVFDPESEAEHEENSAYGRVYYINPLKYASDGKTEPRFADVWADRHALISVAAHEFIHGCGLKQHDEDYAGALTEIMAVVTENLDELSELCWDGQDTRETDADLSEKYFSLMLQLERAEKELAALKK